MNDGTEAPSDGIFLKKKKKKKKKKQEEEKKEKRSRPTDQKWYRH